RPGLRRLRLPPGPPRGEDDAGRQGDADRGGHQPDPTGGHRRRTPPPLAPPDREDIAGSGRGVRCLRLSALTGVRGRGDAPEGESLRHLTPLPYPETSSPFGSSEF